MKPSPALQRHSPGQPPRRSARAQGQRHSSPDAANPANPANAAPTAAELPRLVAHESASGLAQRALQQMLAGNPLGVLLSLVSDREGAGRAAWRSVLRSLIDEGQRYGTTPAGQRWRHLLEQSPALHKGWLLWNHANVDFYLRNAQALDDSPADLLAGAWGELAELDVAAWLSELSRLSTQLDLAAQTQEHA